MKKIILALALFAALLLPALALGGTDTQPTVQPAPTGFSDGGDGFSDGGDQCELRLGESSSPDCGGAIPCTAGRWLAPNEWHVVLCGWNNWRTLDISTAYISGCAVQFYYYDTGPSAAFCSDVSHYQRPGYGYYTQIRVNNYTAGWVYVAVTAST